MLRVTEKQLRSWGRQGLINADGPSFSFHDLLALKTLLKLCEQHIPPRIISRALESLKRKLAGVEHPLSELKIISDSGKIAVQIDSTRKMDAISGQMLLQLRRSRPARSWRPLPRARPADPLIHRSERPRPIFSTACNSKRPELLPSR